MDGINYQCAYCGEFSKKHIEACRFCGSEGIIIVFQEERREWGRRSGNLDHTLLQ